MPNERGTAYQFVDEGAGRDDERPNFERLVAALQRRRAEHEGEPPAVIVSELSRLFRNRQDRAAIDRLVDAREADVVTVRENIDTNTAEGRERYRRAADLLMLAYEGWPLQGTTRAAVIERYASEVLDPWLELVGVPTEERLAPVADVQGRLLALARRWGTAEAKVLLAPYLELADVHEPAELDVALRALAVVGVRNSDLETLHLAKYIEQWDWRVLTQAGAYALSDFDRLPSGDSGAADDPFGDVVEEHPTAAAAFQVLVDMRPGDVRDWEPPDRPRPALPTDAVLVPVTREGWEVQHAMDPRVSRRLAGVLRERCESSDGYAVPSLKHISRNPQKLFRVVDFLLAHGCPVVTANLLIEPPEEGGGEGASPGERSRSPITKPTGRGVGGSLLRAHRDLGETTRACAARGASTSTVAGSRSRVVGKNGTTSHASGPGGGGDSVDLVRCR